MKAHSHRLLINLPDLAETPLLMELGAVFGREMVQPIHEARIDANSVYVRTRTEEGLTVWRVFDRDSLVSLIVVLNEEYCGASGVSPSLDAVIRHLELHRKGKTA